jgi:cytochrome c biogenesis protein CcdA
MRMLYLSDIGSCSWVFRFAKGQRLAGGFICRPFLHARSNNCDRHPISQVAQNTLGRYWKLFGGFIIIFFGLGTLRLLPFKFPKRKVPEDKIRPKGLISAALFGLIVGGGIGFCSMPCNPGIYIVLGVTVLKEFNLWTIAILVAYAIGFSLPLAAIMLGVSFGKSIARAKKTVAAIRIVAGIILIAAGFYFLRTM